MNEVADKERIQKARRKIVELAGQMLNSEIDLIEGCRLLALLAYTFPGNDIFLPIIGISSETDDFPIGEERDTWAPESLSRLDAEKAEYLTKVRETILDTCKDLVSEFAD